MSAGDWLTAVTRIRENEILIRGYPIEELMAGSGYARVLYLLVKGDLPDEGAARLLEAVLVSSVDHGVTPPSAQSAVLSASSGAPINAALAAGILSINDYHGGAIEACMHMLHEAVAAMTARGQSVPEAAEALVEDYLLRGSRLMGYGHRLHSDDPRTRRLLAIARESGYARQFVAMAEALGVALAARGKKLPMNVDAAIAAVLCELEIPPRLANAFFIISRIPGLLAHILEEQERYRPMRKIDFAAARYDGPDPRHLGKGEGVSG